MTSYKQMLVYDKMSIGQRVSLSTKRSGTLCYKGLVSFAPGIWIGIELDEAEGENDGSVDNVRYFSCKKNHGHFCHVSEILSEPSLSETDFYVSSECTTFQESELSIDQNIFKAEGEKGVAFSLMESSDDLKEDLDDSLDIMDLDVLMTKSAEENTSLEDILAYYLFTDDSREDFYNLGHATSSAEQGTLNVTQVISSPEEANLNLTKVISSPEEANLNLTQVIDSSEKQCNLNIVQTIGLPNEQCDLNTTLILNRTTEIEKKVNVDERPILPFFPTQAFNFDDKIRPLPDFKSDRPPKVLGSTIILPFIPTFPDSKSGESPLHKTESSPKYASTPKHEVNYTFTFDENDPNSEQNFSPVSHLNKTIVKHDAIKGKTVFPLCVEPDHDNILPRKTCIELSSDTDVACSAEELRHEELLNELNKTFTNFTLNTTISVSKESEKIVEESLNELDTPQTLNTTYEKKELPKIKVSKVTKQNEVKETKNTRKSKIAKHIDHGPSVFASNTKYSEFDKKKVRKSVSLQSRNNREIPEKNQRKTFGSKSSLSDDIALSQSQKLLQNYDQMQDDAYCGAILKTDSKKISCDKSKKYLMKEGIGIESMKTKRKSIKSAVAISTSIPKPSSRQTEESKSTLKEEQKKVPPKRLSVAECEISSIPSSLMPRPCSNKIEESKSTVQKEKFFEKPKRPPRRFAELKYEIPRAVMCEIPRAIKCEFPRVVSTRKSSLPVSKKESVKSTIKTKKETVRQSGRLQEKRVLSPRNQHDISSGPGPSYTLPALPKITRKQSLGSKTSVSDAGIAPNLRELWLPRQSLSKKKDTKDHDAASSQNLAAVKLPPIVQSHIPLSANRKKDDEKLQSEKSRKKNLR